MIARPAGLHDPRRTLRRRAGDSAEAAAATALLRAGWTILARNVAVGRDEVDILALEPFEPFETAAQAVAGGVEPSRGPSDPGGPPLAARWVALEPRRRSMASAQPPCPAGRPRTTPEAAPRGPGRPGTLVFVEVRSRTVARFGTAEESVDGRKVARLYRAALGLLASGRLPDGAPVPTADWRVDLVTMVRHDPAADWRLDRHLRGLRPP